LLKEAGREEGTVNDLFDRIDQMRMRRPEPGPNSPVSSQPAG
jgi:hypothetical protein